jgi:hypothetical protein
MQTNKRIALCGFLLGFLMFTTGCVVAPGYREGYYDRDHGRYWHEGGWHDCHEHAEFCR